MLQARWAQVAAMFALAGLLAMALRASRLDVPTARLQPRTVIGGHADADDSPVEEDKTEAAAAASEHQPLMPPLPRIDHHEIHHEGEVLHDIHAPLEPIDLRAEAVREAALHHAAATQNSSAAPVVAVAAAAATSELDKGLLQPWWLVQPLPGRPSTQDMDRAVRERRLACKLDKFVYPGPKDTAGAIQGATKNAAGYNNQVFMAGPPFFLTFSFLAWMKKIFLRLFF